MVNYKKLLFELEYSGVGRHVLGTVSKFSANRKQLVIVEGSFRDFNSLMSVVQGSVLGPLLFILFTNDMWGGVSCKVLEYTHEFSLPSPPLNTECMHAICWKGSL